MFAFPAFALSITVVHCRCSSQLHGFLWKGPHIPKVLESEVRRPRFANHACAVFMSRIRLVVSLLLFLVACSTPPGDSGTEVREASGVFRQSDSLLVVDDSVSGAYFKVSLAGEK